MLRGLIYASLTLFKGGQRLLTINYVSLHYYNLKGEAILTRITIFNF